MNIKEKERDEFVNDIKVLNKGTDEHHVEIHYSKEECERVECKHVGSYRDPNDKSDMHMCLNCLIKERIFDELHCNKCDREIFNKEKNTTLANCRCNSRSLKRKNEKPILECMWVRARDYK